MISLLNGDARRIPLADGSVDMIFSDPPYLKRYITGYRMIADEAPRLLKPGGFVAVMCGESYINRIMRWFDDAGLRYYWLYTLAMGGQGATCWRRGPDKSMPIGTPVKHVLVYSNGPAVSRTATVGYYKANGKDKAWHEWGQDVDSTRYYIDCFTYPGDLVLDPMCGGGTTGVACLAIGRRCILGDIDPAAMDTTRRRLDALPLFGNQSLG